MEGASSPHDAGALDRLARFSDVVFGLSLALLVTRIPLPDPFVRNTALHDALGDVVPEISAFVLSFFVIAGLWADHHRLFDRAERRSPGLLWLTLALLFCVAFLPFPGGVVGHHIGSPLAALFFAAAATGTGLLVAALCRHVSPGDTEQLRRALATPLVIALTAPAAAVVISIRGTDVTLAPIVWAVALPLTRVVVERRPARAS